MTVEDFKKMSSDNDFHISWGVDQLRDRVAREMESDTEGNEVVTPFDKVAYLRQLAMRKFPRPSEEIEKGPLLPRRAVIASEAEGLILEENARG